MSGGDYLVAPQRASPRINKCSGLNQLATLDEKDAEEFGGPRFTK